MGNAWSKHVGEWYSANSGKNGINSLKDAMRSAKCKADFRAKMGGPAMKTEKNVMNMKKGKKGTRKVKGGSSLTPANFASEPVQTGKVDTPVVKGGKKGSKGSSLKNVLKSIENSLKKLKGGSHITVEMDQDDVDKTKFSNVTVTSGVASLTPVAPVAGSGGGGKVDFLSDIKQLQTDATTADAAKLTEIKQKAENILNKATINKVPELTDITKINNDIQKLPLP
jgi:hypothetical protein